MLISALLFLSPIFYPISAIPERFQIVCYLNPMSIVVENARRVLMWGELPNWSWIGISWGLGVFVALCGLSWFVKTKKGFADVI